MYTIKNASMITGIGVHTLRAWEKRYSIVTPKRSINGRRQYSDDDIRKLKLITTLNKTGVQISSLAKLSLEELIKRVGNLSEKDLYPNEIDKLESSLFILKRAFEFQFQDVLSHELESLLIEEKRETFRLKSLVEKLLIPYYEYIVTQEEGNPALESRSSVIYASLTTTLKKILTQLMNDFQNLESENLKPIHGRDDSILVGSTGSVRGEIDSLICCIKSYLKGTEAFYIGSLVNKDVVSEFIDQLPSGKVIITDRYVSFRAHPRLFDLMKDLPCEKLEDVEFAVLLHRFDELQKLDFQNSEKVEVFNDFDSVDHFFTAS